jgi:hypothetical protein
MSKRKAVTMDDYSIGPETDKATKKKMVEIVGEGPLSSRKINTRSSTAKKSVTTSAVKSPWRRTATKRLQKFTPQSASKEHDEYESLSYEFDHVGMLVSGSPMNDSSVTESVDIVADGGTAVRHIRTDDIPQLTVFITPYSTPASHEPNEVGSRESVSSVDSWMGAILKSSPNSVSTPFMGAPKVGYVPQTAVTADEAYHKPEQKRAAGTRRISDTPLKTDREHIFGSDVDDLVTVPILVQNLLGAGAQEVELLSGSAPATIEMKRPSQSSKLNWLVRYCWSCMLTT